MWYFNIKKPTIVIDNGSYELKAGFQGHYAPSCRIPTVVGRPKLENSDEDFEDQYFGEEAMAKANALSLKYPIQRGIINDWDGIIYINMILIWNQFGIMQESEHPILLTEVPINPNANREKTMQILFETFQAPLISLVNKAVLPLYAVGKLTGVVVDSGQDDTNIVPVYEGYYLQHAVLRRDYAGNACTQEFLQILNKSGYYFYKHYYRSLIIEMKEKLCYVAQDYDKEIKKYKESGAEDTKYELPDGDFITIKNEKFRCSELLFKPYQEVEVGIHELVYNSLKKCDPSLQLYLYLNIILSGGNTLLKGFRQRLQKELKSMPPESIKPKSLLRYFDIEDTSEHNFISWKGGEILASLDSFLFTCFERKEYDEQGPSIVHRWMYK
ncbi:unnamed protein product (macronuclear) [Paramecium tetraurelia]|uniref:Actin, cytoplasmic n=1 Tax=Paramecium tetraurelia TaxID=5888 RepID=A0E1S8_PARTE|nr:uncharacterized protein GSPATT00022416001 [Paramecium tetraurelia]CAK89245.1 unnamed protein product [Paramecium tetraurelia]|eukprot:XP_001456642.1 hypothetical protein (macronuclear) [Paramecium tetraurelia strain d4-2]